MSDAKSKLFNNFGGIEGLTLIQLEKFEDSRGFFQELYNRAWLDGDLFPPVYQINMSESRKRVIRGMHYQLPPFGQAKIITCISGAIWDVVIDLRSGSKTEGKKLEVEISAELNNALFIPADFAHGFQSLRKKTKICYGVSKPRVVSAERVINPFDKNLSIVWPLRRPLLSDKDRLGTTLPAALGEIRGDN